MKRKYINSGMPLPEKLEDINFRTADCELLKVRQSWENEMSYKLTKYMGSDFIWDGQQNKIILSTDGHAHKVCPFTRIDNRPRRYGFDDQFSTYLRDIDNGNYKFLQLTSQK